HPDGQTLYFMSKGWPGMGGFDLYYARKDSTGAWTRPKNLGYPINTGANEGALVVSLDGTTAYFATDKGSGEQDSAFPGRRGRTTDIYAFELYDEARPQPVTYVKARVTDARDGQALQAHASIVDLTDEAVHAESVTDSQGEFLICLPMGSEYALNVSKEGYLFHSENFALTAAATRQNPFLLEIELTPVPKGLESDPEIKLEPVVLRNVFFETGSAELKPKSRGELNRLVDLLRKNPDLQIRINGHTDEVGTEEDNQKLSEARAKAVFSYLIAEGISEQRLSYQGFGESMPIASNETEEGRRKNRRTEFEVINR
ncbi:MAG: OmpA family protein, partial [Saprospiraceae bacterium]|nr:OmpA family protein [Saprospiraceae bacterium]